MPFEPESSCLVNVSDFTDYADESAYEILRLLGKDLAEFSSLQDEDVLDALTIQLYQEDGKLFYILFITAIVLTIRYRIRVR